MLRDIFPDQQILRNHRYPDVRFAESQRFAEFDIFLPDLALAFEYLTIQDLFIIKISW